MWFSVYKLQYAGKLVTRERRIAILAWYRLNAPVRRISNGDEIQNDDLTADQMLNVLIYLC